MIMDIIFSMLHYVIDLLSMPITLGELTFNFYDILLGVIGFTLAFILLRNLNRG